MINDPLDELLTWRHEIRQKVADALQPFCYLSKYDPAGEPHIYPDLPAELQQKITALAYAVQREKGYRKDHRLTEAQAEALASEIAAQQSVHPTGGTCRECGGAEWSHHLRNHDFIPAASG
jgi:hypothetical protein